MRAPVTKLSSCLSVGALALLVGCGSSSKSHSGPSEETGEQAQASTSHTLRIGVSPHCSAVPAFAARDVGALAKEGLDATFVRFKDGKSALEALERGEVDLAFSGDLPVASSALHHEELRVLATVATSSYEDWI